MIILGLYEGMDVDDLCKNVNYVGGYDEVSFI